ncbi:MAG: HAD-IB family hydrolase, partial [Promicromonosporaceae bacterium]|nr:HAD-IB family hydrolase [Promicromonosporaceae bacterium]
LAKELYKRKFFGTMDLIRFGLIQARYLLQGESKEHIDEVRERALSLIKDHTAAEVVAIGEEVYDAVLGLRIFPGTKAMIEDHLAAGDQVWFVTASPVEIAELIARRLGATGALGTVAETVDGVYTGRLIGDLMHGQEKADAIIALAAVENIDLDASYAYSDSLNDLPMMRLVGHPCAINPDLRLRAYAKKAGWPIENFRGHPIVRRSVRTASVAGGAWAVALIVREIQKVFRNRVGI